MKLFRNVLSPHTLDAVYTSVRGFLREEKWAISYYVWPTTLIEGHLCPTLRAALPDKLKQTVRNELSSCISFPELQTADLVYQVWLPGSGINAHPDTHVPWAATIYLNHWHQDWGGLFIYHESEGPVVRKCLVPEENTMILNDEHKYHQVTPVTINAKQPRFTIQVWPKRMKDA